MPERGRDESVTSSLRRNAFLPNSFQTQLHISEENVAAVQGEREESGMFFGSLESRTYYLMQLSASACRAQLLSPFHS